MFCPNCGNEIPTGKFCPVCGTPVEAPVEETVVVEAQPVYEQPAQPVYEQPAQPVYEQPVYEQPVETEIVQPAVDPGKGKGTASLILGIVALVLGAVCPCLFACLGSIVPLGCSIGGIITGAMGSKASKEAGFKNTKATTGLILSIVALVITAIFCIIGMVFGAAIASEMY